MYFEKKILNITYEQDDLDYEDPYKYSNFVTQKKKILF